MDGLRVRFPRPSLAGHRLALERKWLLNVQAYGGVVSVLTLTAPGAEMLPWDKDECKVDGPHKCSGELGCRVEWAYGYRWNATHAARRQRLWEAATRSADRYITRLWGKPVAGMPRQIGHARDVLQLRGVYHNHWAMPQGSEIEKAWSRHVLRFLQAQEKKERALGPEVVWAAIDREFHTGEITRGIYGFGFAHPGKQSGPTGAAARYLARNSAGYMAGQGAGHYVSTRLTRRTGITMRKLRSVNYLWVRQKLIASGELSDGWVPSHWKPEYAASVLELWNTLQTGTSP